MSTPHPISDDHGETLTAQAYVRIYTGEGGHSYFEDVHPLGPVEHAQSSGQRALFSDRIPVDTAVFRLVVGEAEDSRHNAPRRQFIVMMKGSCEVETSLGESRRFGPGDIILADDLDGYGHVTRRVGTEQRLTMVVTLN